MRKQSLWCWAVLLASACAPRSVPSGEAGELSSSGGSNGTGNTGGTSGMGGMSGVNGAAGSVDGTSGTGGSNADGGGAGTVGSSGIGGTSGACGAAPGEPGGSAGTGAGAVAGESGTGGVGGTGECHAVDSSAPSLDPIGSLATDAIVVGDDLVFLSGGPNESSSKIAKIPRAGGPMTTLYESDALIQEFAISDLSLYIVFRDTPDRLYTVALSGGPAVLVESKPGGWIAKVFLKDGVLYWAQATAEDSPFAIRRLYEGGPSGETMAELPFSLLDSAWKGYWDDKDLFYVRQDSPGHATLVQHPLGCGGEHDLASLTDDERLEAFALDDTHVYWITAKQDGSNGRVLQKNRTTGELRTLFEDATVCDPSMALGPGIWEMKVDDRGVVIPTANGALSLPFDGTGPKRVSRTLEQNESLAFVAMDAQHLFFDRASGQDGFWDGTLYTMPR